MFSVLILVFPVEVCGEALVLHCLRALLSCSRAPRPHQTATTLGMGKNYFAVKLTVRIVKLTVYSQAFRQRYLAIGFASIQISPSLLALLLFLFLGLFLLLSCSGIVGPTLVHEFHIFDIVILNLTCHFRRTNLSQLASNFL